MWVFQLFVLSKPRKDNILAMYLQLSSDREVANQILIFVYLPIFGRYMEYCLHLTCVNTVDILPYS